VSISAPNSSLFGLAVEAIKGFGHFGVTARPVVVKRGIREESLDLYKIGLLMI
jgi:hypothetical protein